MSIATLILGNSGSGKSTSLRNLDPTKTLLIQCIKKPLPFKSKGWSIRSEENPKGNVIQTDSTDRIVSILQKSPHEIVVIDDYQAVMVNELMGRSSERGYDKFTDIGKHAWSVFTTAGSLSAHRRVYILAHTHTDDFGNVRMKTVGKMVDQTIVPEGYFTIVLHTEAINGVYQFRTQTNGQDCAKSPIDMFSETSMPNDVALVDKAICEFYELQAAA